MDERRREDKEDKWIFPCFRFPFPEVEAGVYRGGHLFLVFALFAIFAMFALRRKQVMFTSPDTTLSPRRECHCCGACSTVVKSFFSFILLTPTSFVRVTLLRALQVLQWAAPACPTCLD